MKELEFIVRVPAGADPVRWCQPHEVEAYAHLLGVPGMGGKDAQGEHGFVMRRRYGHTGHVETDPETGESTNIDATVEPHHHLFLTVPDDYEMPPDVEAKLLRALAAGECRPKPLLLPVLTPDYLQIAAEALTFPGYEVCHGDHGGVGMISSQTSPVLGIAYCCYECKQGHDQTACEQVLAKLPDPATRPKRLVLGTKERQVPLERTLVTAEGRKITHEVVTEDVLEDKAVYRARLEQWYLASGCWG